MSELYRDIQAPILVTDPASAEMIKYASNAFLATKISFVNAIANLCESVNADVTRGRARHGLRPTHRVRVAAPGSGIRRLVLPEGHRRAAAHRSRERATTSSLLRSVIEVNGRQRERVIEKLRTAAGGSLQGTVIGVWGLTFKANTDDLRDSPALTIAEAARRRGRDRACLRPRGWRAAAAHCPASSVVDRRLRRPSRAPRSSRCSPSGTSSAGSTSTGSHAAMEPPHALVDARNLLDPSAMRRRGFAYQGSGADATRGRHRRRRVPRFAPVRGAARARLGGRRGRQPLHRCTRERRRISLDRPGFELVEHDVVHGHARSTATSTRCCTSRARRARPSTSRTRSRRSRSGRSARSTRSSWRASTTARGSCSRRPARSTATRSCTRSPRATGQREPRRSAVGVRRGEALRRGDHDGVPPHARARHQDRADLQHLRPSTDAGRRAGGVELPRPGDARRAAHGVRRRQADPFVLLRRRRGRRHPRAARVGPRRADEHRQPDEFTMLELAELRARGHRRTTCRLVFEPLPVDDPQQRRPDIALAREVLGWQPPDRPPRRSRPHATTAYRRAGGTT